MYRSSLKIYFECYVGDYYISAGRYTDYLSQDDYISVLDTTTWETISQPVEPGDMFKAFCNTVSEYEQKTGCKSSRI